MLTINRVCFEPLPANASKSIARVHGQFAFGDAVVLILVIGADRELDLAADVAAIAQADAFKQNDWLTTMQTATDYSGRAVSDVQAPTAPLSQMALF